MAVGHLNDFLRRLTRQMGAESLTEQADAQLVERALAGGDGSAFEAIVRRHGTMVYRVCWRILQHRQDAEDAFQVTFLVLARKLRTVRQHASLASWLHGVAQRVASKAKTQSATRRCRESCVPVADAVPPEDITWKDVRSALDAELSRLPEKWRLPLIHCYLEGQTQDEAAVRLGWSKSTLRRHLEQGRAALGRRLARRGITASAALGATLVSDSIASAAPASGLVASTVEAAAGVAAGKTLTTTASATVAALTEGMVKAMFIAKLKTRIAVVVMLGIIAFGGGSLAQHAAVGQTGVGATSGAPEKEGAPGGGKAVNPAGLPKADKVAKPVDADIDRIVGSWVLQRASAKPMQTPAPTVLGPKAFRDGDVVEITEVRATSPRLEPGDSITVRGRVRLASHDEAQLGLYLTQTEGNGIEETDPSQTVQVRRGLAKFELKATIKHRGVLHLTLYDGSGHPFGGVYFGTSAQMKRIEGWSLDYYLTGAARRAP